MREFTSPASVPLATGATLTDDLVRHARDTPDRALLARRDGDEWRDVPADVFLAEVQAVAKGLIASGVLPGDRVALMSRTRYEWTLLDYAIWYAGAASVPVYPSSSAEQLRFVLADSGARALVVESPAHLSTLADHRAELAELRHAWSIDDNAVELLTTLGGDISDDDLEARRSAVGPDDAATVIYTSGTTGHPKGCVLTHENFETELAGALHELDSLFHDGASTLLVLPLAHVFARIVQVGAVRAGVRLGHSVGTRTLLADMDSFRPTFVLAVPRVFERIFNAASQRAASDGKGSVFDRATQTAIAYSRALDKGRVGPVLRGRHALFDRLVYAGLREALGGSCAYAISGGAPLGERLAHFFRGAGITVLEGYGLTETTGAITVNTPRATRIGSVGRPLPGVTVRIAEDGELLVRGGQVFGSYWEQPAASAEVLQDGWLHTGDLGEIDAEGFVRITGRKKEILVTSGGKNVSPTVLEDRIRSHPLVSQCVVVGDGQPFVAALLTLDPDTLDHWRSQRGKKGNAASLADDPDLRAELQRAIDAANAAVSQAEAVRRFAVLPVDWTEEGGQLTPSLKLKRAVVMRQFRRDIEDLYDH